MHKNSNARVTFITKYSSLEIADCHRQFTVDTGPEDFLFTSMRAASGRRSRPRRITRTIGYIRDPNGDPSHVWMAVGERDPAPLTPVPPDVLEAISANMRRYMGAEDTLPNPPRPPPPEISAPEAPSTNHYPPPTQPSTNHYPPPNHPLPVPILSVPPLSNPATSTAFPEPVPELEDPNWSDDDDDDDL
jgi:hypothetical protein